MGHPPKLSCYEKEQKGTLRFPVRCCPFRLASTYEDDWFCSVLACYSGPMQITVELPEDIALHPDSGRQALEALVLQGYRSHQLTQFQAGQLLGLSRIQTEDFLARYVSLYDYSIQELEAEADLLSRLQR